MIYHWCPATDWRPNAAYRPVGFDDDGFVHCSYAHQVSAAAKALAGGRDDLLLLCIDEALVPVVVEQCADAAEPFPHVYGAIPPGAVVAAIPFPPGPSGDYPLPAGLP